MTVDPLFKRIALIRYKLGEIPFSATGFFYVFEDHLFLITNKHVFEHELGVSPNKIEITFRKKTDETRIKRVSPPAKGGDGKPNWYEHPDHPDADITAFPLTQLDTSEIGNEAFTNIDLVPAGDDTVHVGTDAMVAGYPSTGKYPIRDRETSSAVAVNALVSSSFGEYFDDEPFFLVDAKTYDGMSGSPVLLPPGEIVDTSGLPSTSKALFHESRQGFGILGVHSGPYELDQNLSLNRVWYCDLIDEMIEHFWSS